MIRHLVMWRIQRTEDRTKEENMMETKARLMGLSGQIEELKAITVGINFNPSDAAYDVVLETNFDTVEDLNAYQIHPKHEAVRDFVRMVATARVVVDYEI